MMRTWPITAARTRSALAHAQTSPSSLDLVVVFCKGSLTWIRSLALPTDRRILVYVKCAEPEDLAFCESYQCIAASWLDNGSHSSDECGGYLLHLEQHFHDLAEWTIFLQDDAPRHLHVGYLNLVLKMISQGTLSTLAPDLFLHLNNDRHLIYWTPCLESLQRHLGLQPGLVASYCCSQFLVHRSRIQRRGLGFFRTAARLLQIGLHEFGDCQRSKGERTNTTSGMRLCYLYETRF